MTTPNTQLSVQQRAALAPFEPTNIIEALKLSETLAGSGLVPSALRGKPADILVVLMKGRELGLSPMSAMASIHVIEGKATLSSDLIQGLLLKSGVLEYFQLVESTQDSCTYEAKRKDSPKPVSLRWTVEDARRAGLLGKDNWKKYQATMLRARCAAELGREVAPDVLAGLYDLDEADDIRESAGMRTVEVIDDGKPKRPSTVEGLKAELKERLTPGAQSIAAAEPATPPDAIPAPSPQASAAAPSTEPPRNAQDDVAPFDEPEATPEPARAEAAQAEAKPEPLTTDPSQMGQFAHRFRFVDTAKIAEPWDSWADEQPWRGAMLAGVSCRQAIEGSLNGKRHAGLRGVVEYASKRGYPEGSIPAPALKADWCLAVLEERWKV